MRENRLDAANTLWEYILTTYGYCPGPEHLREERLYHAIFQPTFHRSCFLSLHLAPADAILTFGYFAHIWKLKRYLTILSAIRERQEFPQLSDDAFSYLNIAHMETLREKAVVPAFPDEASIYLRNVHLAIVPSGSIQYFEQQMQNVQPFEVEALMLAPHEARDGISARGIVTERERVHRFDIWPVPLTSRQRAFFLALINVGCACLEEPEQEQLRAIQHYLR